MTHRTVAIASAALLITIASAAEAQDSPDPAANSEAKVVTPTDIDAPVAAALLERGRVLLDAGDYANAKKMFVESLERGPNAPSAAQALDMLRKTNDKLGISDRDDGRPRPSQSGEPVDPYAQTGTGGDSPQDPYGSDPGPAGPVDPYGAQNPDVPEPPRDELAGMNPRKALMAWGGGLGLLTGFALAGPEGDDGNIGGGALLVGAVGAGAGVALAHFGTKRKPMNAGQVAATMSAGTWGALNMALLGDALDCAVDADACATDTNSLYKLSAFGGVAGAGGGAWLAYSESPSEGDVAFVNSLGMYGTAAGLLLGVGIDPPTSEAYSLNAFLGSSAGLTAGLVLARHVETTRRRMLLVDLGAAGGAVAPWILLYPLLADENSTNDEQATGYISTATLAIGAATMWYLTRDSGGTSKSAAPTGDVEPKPLALLGRSHGGVWSLGTPIVRPMENPVLAPPTGGASLGIDLAAGSF